MPNTTTRLKKARPSFRAFHSCILFIYTSTANVAITLVSDNNYRLPLVIDSLKHTTEGKPIVP